CPVSQETRSFFPPLFTPTGAPQSYTLSLHDALPIFREACLKGADMAVGSRYTKGVNVVNWPMSRVLMSYFASVYVRFIMRIKVQDRKSTRLNSSHVKRSYAVFCLKKKTQRESSCRPH